MKKSALAAMLAGLLSVSGAAQSDVIYDFSFSQLTNDDTAIDFANFDVVLRFDDYLTTPGFNAVAPVRSTALPSIGYEIAYAGVTNLGWWAFDDIRQGAIIYDNSFTFDVDSFLFDIAGQTKRITMPGQYSGSVFGNGGSPAQYFRGIGTVTVTEVPEPPALGLFAIGIACMAYRRQKMVNSTFPARCASWSTAA